MSQELEILADRLFDAGRLLVETRVDELAGDAIFVLRCRSCRRRGVVTLRLQELAGAQAHGRMVGHVLAELLAAYLGCKHRPAVAGEGEVVPLDDEAPLI